MKAAVLDAYGATPAVGEFAAPVAAAGQTVVNMAAAGLHHADRLKASGTFYLMRPPLPSVVGIDGVGYLADGRRVFFDGVVDPFGSMAEQALVASDRLIDVPSGVTDLQAAALGNTGMAAWLALSWRAPVRTGETVLVLGAGGALGRVATQAARLLGAGRIVGADLASSRDRVVGADATVDLDGDGDLAERLRTACGGGADLIIDPLWGEPALAAIGAARLGARLVQLGQAAATTVAIPAPLIRSARLDLLAFAYLHAPADARREAFTELAGAVARGDLIIEHQVFPLTAIGVAWEQQGRGASTKLVIDLTSQPAPIPRTNAE